MSHQSRNVPWNQRHPLCRLPLPSPKTPRIAEFRIARPDTCSCVAVGGPGRDWNERGCSTFGLDARVPRCNHHQGYGKWHPSEEPASKKSQNGQNKPNIPCEINDLTHKTNPKQTQNKASKSFISDGCLQNKAKTIELSPLDCGRVKKQSQATAG